MARVPRPGGHRRRLTVHAPHRACFASLGWWKVNLLMSSGQGLAIEKGLSKYDIKVLAAETRRQVRPSWLAEWGWPNGCLPGRVCFCPASLLSFPVSRHLGVSPEGW